MFKKLLSLTLAVLTVTAVSCASESPAVMTYGESAVTEAMYTYYVSTFKGRYIQAYTDITDTEEFWDSEVVEGKTGEEVIEELIYGNVAQNLVAAEEFRKAGLSLSDDDTAAVDDYIDSMVTELSSGSRKTMNSYLSEFGINLNMLRDIFLMEQKAQVYYEHLYGKDGTEAVTDTDRAEYYTANYVRFQQIYINNIEIYEKDEDGYYVQDESGNYVKRELTEDELAEAEAKIAAVKTALEAGEDFDALKEKYSDSQDYDRGYYFSATTSTDYITAVVSAAFALEEGEWTYVEAAKDAGAFFIKRLPLEENAWSDTELADFFEDFDTLLTEEKYSEKIESLYGSITKNDDYLAKVSVKDAPANYYYY